MTERVRVTDVQQSQIKKRERILLIEH